MCHGDHRSRLSRRHFSNGRATRAVDLGIHRKSQPLGIKMTGDGFQSESAAEFAGKKALADFLSDLAKEDKRPLK
jgi:hypothetical protein